MTATLRPALKGCETLKKSSSRAPIIRKILHKFIQHHEKKGLSSGVFFDKNFQKFKKIFDEKVSSQNLKYIKKINAKLY